HLPRSRHPADRYRTHPGHGNEPQTPTALTPLTASRRPLPNPPRSRQRTTDPHRTYPAHGIPPTATEPTPVTATNHRPPPHLPRSRHPADRYRTHPGHGNEPQTPTALTP